MEIFSRKMTYNSKMRGSRHQHVSCPASRYHVSRVQKSRDFYLTTTLFLYMFPDSQITCNI